MAKKTKFKDMIKSNMNIIFLRGKHNCGKTTTFNLLYDELCNKGAEVVEPQSALPGRDDFECILKYNKKKIALFSLGDYGFAPSSAIGYYTRVECDILVVAYSLGKSICNNRLFTKRYPNCYPEPIIIDKESKSDNDAVNEIITKIEAL